MADGCCACREFIAEAIAMSDPIQVDNTHAQLDARIARFAVAALPRGWALAHNAYGFLYARSAGNYAIRRVADVMLAQNFDKYKGAEQRLKEHCVFLYGVGTHWHAPVQLPKPGQRDRKYARVPSESGEQKALQALHWEPPEVGAHLAELRRHGGKAVPVEAAEPLVVEKQEYEAHFVAGRISKARVMATLEACEDVWSLGKGGSGVPLRCTRPLPDLPLL